MITCAERQTCEPASPNKKGVEFCCCEGSECNKNISFLSVVAAATPQPSSATRGDQATTVKRQSGYQVLTVVLCSILPLVLLAVIVISIALLWQVSSLPLVLLWQVSSLPWCCCGRSVVSPGAAVAGQ